MSSSLKYGILVSLTNIFSLWAIGVLIVVTSFILNLRLPYITTAEQLALTSEFQSTCIYFLLGQRTLKGFLWS